MADVFDIYTRPHIVRALCDILAPTELALLRKTSTQMRDLIPPVNIAPFGDGRITRQYTCACIERKEDIRALLSVMTHHEDFIAVRELCANSEQREQCDAAIAAMAHNDYNIPYQRAIMMNDANLFKYAHAWMREFNIVPNFRDALMCSVRNNGALFPEITTHMSEYALPHHSCDYFSEALCESIARGDARQRVRMFLACILLRKFHIVNFTNVMMCAVALGRFDICASAQTIAERNDWSYDTSAVLEMALRYERVINHAAEFSEWVNMVLDSAA